MPAVIQCTQCQRQLNVLEAHLGAMVRCPVCKTMFTAVAVGGMRAAVPMPVPQTAPPLSPKTAPAIPAPAKPPAVASYAPAGSPPVASYAPPPTSPPAFAPPPAAAFAPPSPPATPSAPADEQDPFWEGEPPPERGPSRGQIYHSEFDEDEGVAQRVVRPHRGPLIMGLGIASLVFFCIFPVGWVLGGIAVALGASDLQEISRGRMDRAGRTQTEIGRWCGVAAAILATIVCLAWLLWLMTTTTVNS